MMLVLSLNMCLGLSNKINFARNSTTIVPYNVMFFYETEITTLTDIEWLQIQDYTLYHTPSTPKSRICAYVKLSRTQSLSLDKSTSNHDSNQQGNYHGIYRPFKVPNHSVYLDDLIEHIELTKANNKLQQHLVGDLNFDFSRRTEKDYPAESSMTNGLDSLTITAFNNLWINQLGTEL